MIDQELIRIIRSQFALDWSGIHGARHWSRVRENGLRLAAVTGAKMKVVEYVTMTGLLFGLLTLVHIWRVVEEGVGILKNPWWFLVTLVAAGLCLWACRLLWLARSGRQA